MKVTELVTLMDSAAGRLESENNHEAAIVMRAGAEALRSHGIEITIEPAEGFVLRVADSLKQIQQRRG